MMIYSCVCVRVCCVVIMHGFAVVSFLYAAVNSVKKESSQFNHACKFAHNFVDFLFILCLSALAKTTAIIPCDGSSQAHNNTAYH